MDKNAGFRDRRYLMARIREYSHIQLSEYHFAIKTEKHQVEVFNDLMRFLEEADRVLVIPLNGFAVGQHTQETFEWLNTHMSQAHRIPPSQHSMDIPSPSAS